MLQFLLHILEHSGGFSLTLSKNDEVFLHTAYSWNIMCQKWEGDCGLWVLNDIILERYAESLKKIVGAILEFPTK